MPLASGTKLGRYEIRSKIGEGGMGEVYLAEDTTLHRRVAIKFLPLDSPANEHANRRLLREAQATAKLDHPNICAVHEISEHDGRSFIVMPYLEGETLEVRLKRQPLELSQSLAISAQVANALTEAHSHGIIHRDIKPSNIMLSPRGQAKVMDFGLAKLSAAVDGDDGLKVNAECSTQTLLTTPGTIIGTVPYMSPEQVHGKPLDPRTDIFSFGVVLYEMLTRQRPFAAESPAGLISAILTKEPQPVSDYLEGCPVELQSILNNCLEKDRERRYQTMREVALDIESVCREWQLGGESAATSRAVPTVSSKLRSNFWSARSLRIAFAVVGIIGLVVLAYALFFKLPRTSPPSFSSLNSSAYDYYLRGKLNAGSENVEKNQEAIKILEDVVRSDPSFAPAYAELAQAYSMKANYFAPGAERKKLYDDAKVAVEKSLVLNPDLAEAYSVRALIIWTPADRFPHEQAIQSLKRALALDPNLEDARHRLGVIYYHIGLLDKGQQELEKAALLNPGDAMVRFRLGMIEQSRTNYEKALAILKTVPREANPAIVQRAMANILIELGRIQEASEIIEEFLKTNSDEGGNVTSVKAMLLAKTGHEREAEEAIQRAVEIGRNFQHFHHTTYNIASAYAILNKPDDALKWLQFTADEGFPCYPFFEKDANLNNLRKDQRFIAFMAKLKQQWERFNATL